MPPIAEPIAEHIAAQIPLQDWIVESALTGDPEPALRALIEDPASPGDEDVCRALFDEMLGLQAAELPYGAAA
jgi:alpha-galactosidase/6-phospho-beta-glucosidase family protein